MTSFKFSFKKARLVNLVSKGTYLNQIPSFSLLVNKVDRQFFIFYVINDFSICSDGIEYQENEQFKIVHLSVVTFLIYVQNKIENIILMQY